MVNLLLKNSTISFVLSSVLASSLSSAPLGENIISGDVNIDRSKTNIININQTTNKSIINWQSFNINQNETVNFNMPNSNASSLNRVIGNDASKIYGKLNSNGQVFLVNEHGIYFGKDSIVNTSGFISTTKNITDQNYLDSNYIFEGDSKASIINLGTIDTQNAYTALLAKDVINQGIIKANLGVVHLASGDKFRLNINGNSLISLIIEKGMIEGLVDNQNLVIANAGEVYMTTKAVDEVLSSVVSNSGKIQANSIEEKDGKVILFAHGGSGNYSGVIEVKDGFVETSGAKIDIDEDLKVYANKWLIDPVDFTIAASGGDMTGATLSNNLANTNIEIQSTNGATDGDGNIYVNDTITWSSGNTLTLNAQRDIFINQSIDASSGSGGKLVVKYGQDSASSGNDARYYINAEVNLQDGQNFSRILGNDGSAVDYTVISTISALQDINNQLLINYNNGVEVNYALGTNIDLSGVSWTPLGINADMDKKFRGDFDGLGHTVSNLTMNSTSEYNGFFGITANSFISNIGIIDANIVSTNVHVGILAGRIERTDLFNSYSTGSVQGTGRTGGLVGLVYWDSIVDNSYSTASVTSNGSDIGGLTGYLSNNSVIKNSYSTGDVQAARTVGGLVGYSIDNNSIIDSYSTSDVTAIAVSGTTNEYIGGLIGWARNSSTIESSYASGVVTGLDSDVGGLVGKLTGSTVTNSYSTGDVNNPRKTGGLVGYADGDSVISDSYSTSNVTSTIVSGITNEYTGGLVGWLQHSSIADSYSTGTVNGFVGVGGLAGAVNYNSNVSNSYSTSNVSGTDKTGGLIGYLRDESSLEYGYSSGTVDGITSSGGLIGYVEESSVKYSHTDSITKGYNAVGGFVGHFDGYNINESIIEESFSTGDVIGLVSGSATTSINMGGFAGYLRRNAIIKNSYSTSNIDPYNTSADDVGLFVGQLNDTSSVINSYTTGTILKDLSSSGENGFISWGDTSTNTISNLFFDTDLAGFSNSMGNSQSSSDIIGKTTSDMKLQSTYTNWDFNNIWAIVDGSFYPVLKNLQTENVTVTIDDHVKTYDGNIFSSPTYTKDVINIILSGTLTPTTNIINAGTHTLNANGLTWSTQEDFQKYGSITYEPATLIINKKPIDLSVEKIYDGTVDFSSNFILNQNDIISGDTVNISGSVTTSLKDANTYTSFVVNNLLLDNNNYELNNIQATINKKPIDLSVEKTYDGTVDFNSNFVLNQNDIISGDIVNISGSATTSLKDANTYTSFVVNNLLLDNNNYELNNIQATINKKPIDLSVEKIYDGTVDFNNNFVLNQNDIISGDNVNISGSATTSLKDANTYTSFVVNNLLLDNNNYELNNIQAIINKKPIDLSVEKTYDGTVDFSSNFVLNQNDIISGDTVNISGSATTSLKDANTYTSFVVNNLLLDNNNYELNNIQATINKKPIDLSVEKTYDGTVDFSSNFVLNQNDIISGDIVNISGNAKIESSSPSIYNSFISSNLLLDNNNYTLDGGKVQATIHEEKIDVENVIQVTEVKTTPVETVSTSSTTSIKQVDTVDSSSSSTTSITQSDSVDSSSATDTSIKQQDTAESSSSSSTSIKQTDSTDGSADSDTSIKSTDSTDSGTSSDTSIKGSEDTSSENSSTSSQTTEESTSSSAETKSSEDTSSSSDEGSTDDSSKTEEKSSNSNEDTKSSTENSEESTESSTSEDDSSSQSKTEEKTENTKSEESTDEATSEDSSSKQSQPEEKTENSTSNEEQSTTSEESSSNETQTQSKATSSTQTEDKVETSDSTNSSSDSTTSINSNKSIKSSSTSISSSKNIKTTPKSNNIQSKIPNNIAVKKFNINNFKASNIAKLAKVNPVSNIQNIEKSFKKSGFNNTQSQKLSNTLLGLSLSKKGSSQKVVKKLLKAMDTDTKSKKAQFSSGKIVKTDKVFDKALQQLLAKNISFDEAMKRAKDLSSKLKNANKSEKQITSLSSQQKNLFSKLLKKGINQKDALKKAQNFKQTKDTKISKIASGKLVIKDKEYKKALSKLSQKYSLQEAVQKANDIKSKANIVKNVEQKSIENIVKKDSTLLSNNSFKQVFSKLSKSMSLNKAYIKAKDIINSKQRNIATKESYASSENLKKYSKIFNNRFLKELKNGKSTQEAQKIAKSFVKKYDLQNSKLNSFDKQVLQNRN
jgi:filamentous hemagglutinin family protein